MSREIDIQIAEKVMSSTVTEINGQILENGPSVKQPTKGGILLRRYSTNIADAWQVVEKMMSLGFSCRITILSIDKSYGITFFNDNLPEYFASGFSVPLSICEAALKALAAINKPKD